MATFFTMPKLGMNMVEGHIVAWLAKEGDQVKEGEPILEIETDKATNEVESPASGILGKITRQEGEDVPCNSVIAVILGEGETLPTEIPDTIGGAVAPKSDVSGTTAVSTTKSSSTSTSIALRTITSRALKKTIKMPLTAAPIRCDVEPACSGLPRLFVNHWDTL